MSENESSNPQQATDTDVVEADTVQTDTVQADAVHNDVVAADTASATVVVIEDKTKQESNNKVEVESNTDILKSPTPEAEINNPSGFGKDFNWEMHEENRKLKEENKIIVEKLKQKQNEIVNLEEALTTLHEEVKFLESQEVQSVAKDLAKKNRQLSVQLQRERTRRSQIHIESQKLKSELATFSHHHLSPKKVVQPMSFSKRPDLIGINEEIERTENNNEHKKEKYDKEKDELKQLKIKLMRTKDEIVKYKDTIKKLNIALKKEIGDDTKDINQIIKDGGSWKGRSEKIAILKHKLSETKRELDLLNDIGTTKENVNVIRNKNEQHKHNISQMAAQRMKQYEDAQIQIEKLVAFNNELRDVLKAKNCRIKGIESNLSSIRKKLQFFIQKSKTDDALVETLQSQLNEQLKLRNSLDTKQKLLKKNNNELNTLSVIIQQQDNKIEILNKTIDEMKDKIINLTEQRTDKFKKMFEKFNNDDKSYQIQILQVENDKQKDIILTYKKNLVNLQKRLSRKSSPRMQDSVMHTNRSSAKSSSKISQLKGKMEAMTQEQQLTKASYLSIIEGKEKEIEICRQLNLQQKNNYQQCMKEMKDQINKIQSEVLGS